MRGGPTALPDGPEGGQWPHDLTEGGRQAGSQASPTSFLPAGSPTPPHAPLQKTPFWGARHPAMLQCPGVGWGGRGGVVAPPAWQPRARRWQRLGSRCGGICAFAPAAHGHRREQDAPCGGSRPAAPNPGGSRESLGQQPLPPSDSWNVVGCGWALQQLGECWLRDTPNPARILESKGAPSTSIPASGCGLTPGPPAAGPAVVMPGLGPAGSPARGQGRPGMGSGHPRGTPMQGQAAHPRQRQRVLPAR